MICFPELSPLANVSSLTPGTTSHASTLSQHLAQCLAIVGAVPKKVPPLGDSEYRPDVHLGKSCTSGDVVQSVFQTQVS